MDREKSKVLARLDCSKRCILNEAEALHLAIKYYLLHIHSHVSGEGQVISLTVQITINAEKLIAKQSSWCSAERFTLPYVCIMRVIQKIACSLTNTFTGDVELLVVSVLLRTQK